MAELNQLREAVLNPRVDFDALAAKHGRTVVALKAVVKRYSMQPMQIEPVTQHGVRCGYCCETYLWDDGPDDPIELARELNVWAAKHKLCAR